jgi:hypothetical protein
MRFPIPALWTQAFSGGTTTGTSAAPLTACSTLTEAAALSLPLALSRSPALPRTATLFRATTFSLPAALSLPATLSRATTFSLPPTLSLPAPLTTSGSPSPSLSISSDHLNLLLLRLVHISATASTAPPASRHRVQVLLQTAAEPGLSYFLQVACDKGDHLNSVRSDHRSKRPRDGAAHQRTDTELREAKRSSHGHLVVQDLIRLGDDTICLDIDDANPLRRVEHGRYSRAPICKCHLHYRFSDSPLMQKTTANAVPSIEISRWMCN